MSSIKYHTHVCLVSKELVPNVTPVLTKSFRPKRVVLVVSKQMVSQRKRLENIYKKYQIGIEYIEIDDAFKQEEIYQKLSDWACEQDALDGIVLNLTGGTKLMSVAAMQALSSDGGLPFFYVHPEKNYIELIHSIDQPAEQIPLDNVIKIKEFLHLHGFDLMGHRTDINVKNRELTHELIANIEMHKHALFTLNYFAQKCVLGNRLYFDFYGQMSSPDKQRDFERLLDLFAKYQVLERRGGYVSFADEDSRFYANGGWLEEHIYDQLSQIKGIVLQDIALSVRVDNQDSRMDKEKSFNELDIAFLHNNRLYILECKARNFSHESNAQHLDTALYKLDALKHLGGPMTQGILVSYDDLRHVDRERAELYRLKTFSGHQLSSLKGVISSMLDPS